ncbi:hypothetical protein GCM10028864_36140 [Microlunatus parietis]
MANVPMTRPTMRYERMLMPAKLPARRQPAQASAPKSGEPDVRTREDLDRGVPDTRRLGH